MEGYDGFAYASFAIAFLVALRLRDTQKQSLIPEDQEGG